MLHFFICLLVVMVGWTDSLHFFFHHLLRKDEQTCYITLFVSCYGRTDRCVTFPFLFRPILWPNEIIGMAIAMVAILDFMSKYVKGIYCVNQTS